MSDKTVSGKRMDFLKNKAFLFIFIISLLLISLSAIFSNCINDDKEVGEDATADPETQHNLHSDGYANDSSVYIKSQEFQSPQNGNLNSFHYQGRDYGFSCDSPQSIMSGKNEFLADSDLEDNSPKSIGSDSDDLLPMVLSDEDLEFFSNLQRGQFSTPSSNQSDESYQKI